MSWSTTLKNRQRIRAALEQGDDIAIMFSDIRGFTTYTAREGDRAAFQLSQLHRRLMEDPIESGGGVLVKTLGDGIMAAFPQPGDGLAAAAAIQREISEHNRQGGEAPFDVGIGLASGAPVMTEGDLIGHSVNLSQRISALAKGGQILVPAELHDTAPLPEDTHYIPVGERTLKGLGTVDIYELVWMPERARLTDGNDLVTLILTDRDTLVVELAKDVQATGSDEDSSSSAFSRLLSRWIHRGTQALIRGSLAAFGVSREHPTEDVSISLRGRDLVVDVAGQAFHLRDVDAEHARRFIEEMERSQAGSP